MIVLLVQWKCSSMFVISIVHVPKEVNVELNGWIYVFR